MPNARAVSTINMSLLPMSPNGGVVIVEGRGGFGTRMMVAPPGSAARRGCVGRTRGSVRPGVLPQRGEFMPSTQRMTVTPTDSAASATCPNPEDSRANSRGRTRMAGCGAPRLGSPPRTNPSRAWPPLDDGHAASLTSTNPAARVPRRILSQELPGSTRRTPPGIRAYSITTPVRSSGGAGYCGFSSSRVSAMMSARARLRNQLRLAGITYHGAASVEVRRRTSSSAAT